MLKIKILTVGKIKEQWLISALEEYEKRLLPSMQISWILAKNDEHLELLSQKEPFYICLDSLGEELTSSAFHKTLFSLLEKHASSLCFIIGGPLGLHKTLKRHFVLSLSKLTLTHQMCRLFLIEQLYRAVETWKGNPYGK